MNLGSQLEGLLGDLRFAARSLRRSLGFGTTTIVSLTLGLALTASTLSVVNGYLVRAMPFPESERLYRALYDAPGQPEPRGLERVDWKSLGDVVEVADYSSLGRFILHTDKYPQEISSLECAPGALEAIGVRAALGREFSADDFRPGGERVIMISDALWRERFGARPGVLGTTMRVSRASSGDTPTEYRIIGVLPRGFRYAGNYVRDPADTALPLTAPRAAYMVRLQEGVSPAFAARRITEGVRSVASEIPAGWRGVRLESVHAQYVRDVRPILVGVMVAAALMLLIVVTNIAVLMLLRALRRQKDTAIRTALGAAPHRIARLLFAEAALICGIALAAGIAVTAVMLRALGLQIEARLGLPVPGGVSALGVDDTVLLWIGGIGLLIAVIVACLPMMGVRPARLADSLRGESRSSTDRPTVRGARTILITLEVAASTALLIGGGLMLRSVAHLVGTNLGYETTHVVRSRIQLPTSNYPDADSFPRFYDRLGQQLAAIPNLSFGLSTLVPFWEPPTRRLETEYGENVEPRVSITAVGPDFFRTLRMGVREGRAFTLGDRMGAEPVVVISESLARTLAPRGNILGTRVRTDESEWSETDAPRRIWRTVVGVVHDVHHTPADTHLMDAYVPFAQTPSRFGSVYIRADGSSQQWLETLRTVVASIDPEVFVGPAPPLSLQADEILAGPRFITAVLTAFALFAALLALLGIYGATAYAVQQREREIAIRIAVGATASDIIRMFLRSSGGVLLTGIAGGILGGAAVSGILQSQLHGVDRFDPWTFVVSGALLASTGLFATWLPVRRVTRADPMMAWRTE